MSHCMAFFKAGFRFMRRLRCRMSRARQPACTGATQRASLGVSARCSVSARSRYGSQPRAGVGCPAPSVISCENATVDCCLRSGADDAILAATQRDSHCSKEDRLRIAANETDAHCSKGGFSSRQPGLCRRAGTTLPWERRNAAACNRQPSCSCHASSTCWWPSAGPRA